MDAARAVLTPREPMPKDIPADVLPKLNRGRTAMKKNAAKRRLCMRFRRNETYWFVNEKNQLDFQSTVTHANGQDGKPPQRIRNHYDFLGPIIDAKVSAATSKVPSYEINPSTGDPQDKSRAKTAEQVALYGYDQWRLRTATLKAVDFAIGGGGVAYALPYFDPNVGPYTQVGEEWVGRGDIKVLVLSGNQVYSETGCDFDDSAWYAIERARPIDEVKLIPGFIGIPLSADAQTSDIPTDRQSSDNLVMVTEFFERPCPQYPEGRCMTFANNRPIVDYRLVDPEAQDSWGPYPLIDSAGDVLDEPILHRLVYRHDPDTDRRPRVDVAPDRLRAHRPGLLQQDPGVQEPRAEPADARPGRLAAVPQGRRSRRGHLLQVQAGHGLPRDPVGARTGSGDPQRADGDPRAHRAGHARRRVRCQLRHRPQRRQRDRQHGPDAVGEQVGDVPR
jgi:hypothetical protein